MKTKIAELFTCPWCQSLKEPIANPNKDRINPIACIDCGGVGGYEDWHDASDGWL